MQSASMPRGTNLAWADSLRTTAVPDGILRPRGMDSFGYALPPQRAHSDRNALTSPFAGIDMRDSFVMTAYQNHARSHEPTSDKLFSLESFLDDPQLPGKVSSLRNKSTTSPFRCPSASHEPKNPQQLQDYDDCQRLEVQKQKSATYSGFPCRDKYTPSLMEPDALGRKTIRPSSALAPCGTFAWNAVAGAQTHTAQPPALVETGAQIFTNEQGLAQSVLKSLGLNRRRLTEQMTKRLFDEWDADGSNGISRQEFTRAILRLRPITSPTDIKSAFDEADLNKDGVLEMHEFVAWLGLNRST